MKFCAKDMMALFVWRRSAVLRLAFLEIPTLTSQKTRGEDGDLQSMGQLQSLSVYGLNLSHYPERWRREVGEIRED